VKNGIILLTAAVLFVACSESKYENAEDVSELSISFNDPQWDGILVPKIGQCKNCGGGGLSPALKVKNIPKVADLLIVEFNDKTIPGGRISWQSNGYGMDGRLRKMPTNIRTFSARKFCRALKQRKFPVTIKLRF
jgi:hypothetical protein